MNTALPQISTPPKKPATSIKCWLKRLIWTGVALFIGFHLMVLALLGVWQTQPINNSMFMLLHRLGNFEGVSQTWVEDDQISINAKRAAIASEDADFVNHDGFDIDGIEKAMRKNEKLGTVRAGGSTISQQLAKNLFLFPQRSYIRKGEEAIITIMMEQMWTKERILTAYLNVAEFGNGIYGVEAAAQHYFHRPAKKLTRQQAAMLIAMLPNPKYFERHLNDRHLQHKIQIILQRMGGADLPDGE